MRPQRLSSASRMIRAAGAEQVAVATGQGIHEPDIPREQRVCRNGEISLSHDGRSGHARALHRCPQSRASG
jgi:hypothetical protein